MPTLSSKSNASYSTENQVPDFNSDTLRNLTEQIESNLKNQGKEAISKGAAARPNTNVNEKFREDAIGSPVLISAIQAASNGSTAPGRQQPTVASMTSHGKKRSRDGRIKEKKDKTKGKYVDTNKFGANDMNLGSDNDNNIDKEIRALGGTKEDIDLIANIMSESEMEDEQARPSKNRGNDFEKEILQLVRQLGVDRVAKKELVAESESEEANEVEELDENWNPDITPLDNDNMGVKLALQNVTSIGRGQRSLVSKQQCLVVCLPDDHADFGLV